MSVTSLAESGIWVGELLLGAPPSGNTFWNFNGVVAVPTSTADQFTALSGGMQQPFIDPGDAHLLHGMGPITIGRNKTATFWIVLLAGDNYAQLLANAAAAQADVAANNHGPAGAAATDGPLTASGAGLKVKQFTKKGALR